MKTMFSCESERKAHWFDLLQEVAARSFGLSFQVC